MVACDVISQPLPPAMGEELLDRKGLDAFQMVVNGWSGLMVQADKGQPTQTVSILSQEW